MTPPYLLLDLAFPRRFCVNAVGYHRVAFDCLSTHRRRFGYRLLRTAYQHGLDHFIRFFMTFASRHVLTDTFYLPLHLFSRLFDCRCSLTTCSTRYGAMRDVYGCGVARSSIQICRPETRQCRRRNTIHGWMRKTSSGTSWEI